MICTHDYVDLDKSKDVDVLMLPWDRKKGRHGLVLKFGFQIFTEGKNIYIRQVEYAETSKYVAKIYCWSLSLVRVLQPPCNYKYYMSMLATCTHTATTCTHVL